MRFKVSHIVLVVIALAFAPAAVRAQDAIVAPTPVPTEDGAQETISPVLTPLTQEDIEKSLFNGKKSGCRLRFEFFTVAMIQYKRGIEASDFAEMKIAVPMIEKEYALLREKGVTESSVAAMQAYQECGGSAIVAESEASYEEAQKAAYDTCGGINAIALTALDGIVRKQPVEAMEVKVADLKLDMTDTLFETAENPEKIIVQQIYDANKNGGYEKAVEYGFGLVSSCLSGRL
jgi:hypothetical protein